MKAMPVMKDTTTKLEITTFEFFKGEPGLEFHGRLVMEDSYRIPAFLRFNHNQLVGNLPLPLELKNSQNKPIEEGLTVIKICYEVNVKWYRDLKAFESQPNNKMEELLENQKARVTSLNRRVPKIYNLIQKYTGQVERKEITIASIKMEYNPQLKRYFVDDLMIQFRGVCFRGNKFTIQNPTLNWREIVGDFKSAWSSTQVFINLSENNFLSGKFDMRWMPFEEISVYRKEGTSVLGELSTKVEKDGTFLLQGDSRFFSLTEGPNSLEVKLNGLSMIGSIKSCAYSFSIISIPANEILMYLNENESSKGSYKCSVDIFLPIGPLKVSSNTFDPSKGQSMDFFTNTFENAVFTPLVEFLSMWSASIEDALEKWEDSQISVAKIFVDLKAETLEVQGKLISGVSDKKKKPKEKNVVFKANIKKGVGSLTVDGTTYKTKIKASNMEYKAKQHMLHYCKERTFVDVSFQFAAVANNKKK